ncbi:hypothetical protein VIGAN_UM082600, partial [Vigna angularis var. angularis]
HIEKLDSFGEEHTATTWAHESTAASSFHAHGPELHADIHLTVQQAPCDKQKSTRGPAGRKKGTERGRRCRKKRSRSRVYIREELEGKRGLDVGGASRHT